MIFKHCILLSFIGLLASLAAAAHLPGHDLQNKSRKEAKSPSCRCFPGDHCWPSHSEWSRFNESVGGRLIATVPLAAPCHGDRYDEAECKRIQEAWHDPSIHIQSSSSIMAPFFANLSCDPFLPREAQCIVGTYVQYAVDARSTSDFKAVLKFAKTHNIRLVVRNTAHDFLGKSSGAGALALWTHHLKAVDVIDYKKPYYSGKALRVTAGTQLADAYQVAHNQGLVVVGGTCPSVGLAGGYSQGGGHGLSVSKLGLGADQTLEWEVMTVHGDILVATPEKNADLYWALGGGGGCTYGIVLSLTVKAYPNQKTAAANLTFTSDGISQETYYAGIERYIASLPALLDAGGTSTWLNSDNYFQLSPAVGLGMTKDEIDGFHRPLLEALDDLGISYS